MASDKGDVFDERLAEARDKALTEGEDIIAQEMGDQGQAVVLTGARVLLIKAGLAATGTLNCKKVTAYPISDITAVNVRKGPMGAVLQVCTAEAVEATQGRPPDNVAVFSGPARVKKCEALAAAIQEMLGDKVNTIGPGDETEKSADEPVAELACEENIQEKPKSSRGGRRPRSLAEEMYSEIMPQAQSAIESSEQTTDAPVEEPVTETAAVEEIPGVPVPPIDLPADPHPSEPHPPVEIHNEWAEILEEETEAEEEMAVEVTQTNPNPRLPMPVKRKKGPNSVLVLLGVLAAVVILSVAITAPLKQSTTVSLPEINMDDLTRKPAAIRKEKETVTAYRARVKFIVQLAESGVADKAQRENVDKAWRDMDKTKAPSGLAAAKADISSGLFNMKMGAGENPVNSAKIAQGRKLVAKGMKAIDAMVGSLDKELAESGSSDKCKSVQADGKSGKSAGKKNRSPFSAQK